MNYAGVIAAILTAVCWAITSTSFEDAGKKIGSVNLNLIRLVFAFVFLSTYTFVTRGMWLPMDASRDAWIWLALSGLVGIVIGDLLLFEAFVRIGARVSMLIYSIVPPLSGLIAYLFLGEAMTVMQIIGTLVTVAGIALVILEGGGQKEKIRLSHPVVGILLAFGGAVGQAAGYIIGKYGLGDYDPFAATQIRLLAGIAGFIIIFSVKGYWKGLMPVLKKPGELKSTVIGSFFGPFIGISLSMYAVQRMNPGVASTLISITPVLLIPFAVIVKKEKLIFKEVVGSMIAIGGLALLFV